MHKLNRINERKELRQDAARKISNPTILGMSVHIEELCKAAAITIRYVTHYRAWACPISSRLSVHIHRIKSRITYATALHEIGHILGSRHDYSKCLDHFRKYKEFSNNVQCSCPECKYAVEAIAWEWAQKNALFWSESMEKTKQKALATYKPDENSWNDCCGEPDADEIIECTYKEARFWTNVIKTEISKGGLALRRDSPIDVNDSDFVRKLQDFIKRSTPEKSKTFLKKWLRYNVDYFLCEYVKSYSIEGNGIGRKIELNLIH